MSKDEYYINRCLELAQLGKGKVAPNPMVGAVLVHKDRVIGEGWHQQYGRAHAEVNCIENVKELDRHLIKESIMYVSLEPCSHHGNTPPCASRLVTEQVKEVIICNIDPFPKVQGGGMEILHAANVTTKQGILEKNGLWVNRRFFCFHEQKRPYIILKWAQSANGYFAPLDRSRLQLTNKSSKQLVHKWRTEEAAILVGYQTALKDNPELTARDWEGNSPLRIVLDRELQLASHLHLFDKSTDTWIVNNVRDEIEGSLSYIKLDFNIDLIPQLLQKLYSSRKLSLIVEGGTKLLQSFIDAGLWDEARVFTADKILTDGIEAPVLNNAKYNYTANIFADKLDLYTKNNTGYKYQEGLGL